MPSESFILRTTIDKLVDWIKRYAVVFPPPDSARVRFEKNTPSFELQEEMPRLEATVYRVTRMGRVDPLFELTAAEAEGICLVAIDCLDRQLEGWFCEMIERLAPNRASGRAQPLPELPVGNKTELVPPPAASEPETAAPQREHGEPVTPVQASQPPQAPPLPSTPDSSPPAPRGRPSFPDWYKKKMVELWFKQPDEVDQKAFCRGKPFTDRTLRRWIVWYIKKIEHP